MARQPEGTIKDDCRKIAKRNALMFRQIEGKGINGIPDTLAEHVDGDGVVFIEFKTPDGTVSEQQDLRAEELRKAGSRVWICRSVEDYEIAVGLREATL